MKSIQVVTTCENLEQLRKAKGIKQTTLCKALGITKQGYSLKEKGYRRFKESEVKIISEILNESYEDLVYLICRGGKYAISKD